MKKFLSLAALALFATSAMAQSPKAQMKMEEGKFTEAIPVIEAEIAKVDTDCKAAADKAAAKGKPFDASKFNAKYAGLYNQSAKCWAQVFTPELMNAAQNQPLDTLKFIKALDNTVEHANKSYTYDNTPNAKGEAKPKFNEDNLRIVENCLDYYFYAGYFLVNSDKAGAATYFQKHLDMPSSPMLVAKKDEIIASKRDNYEQCAYFNTIINYELKNYDKLLQGVDFGLKNKEYAHDLYLMKAEAVLETTKDTAQYVAVLKDAIVNVENNTSFAENIITIYSQNGNSQEALAVANEMVERNPNSVTAWYMKGYVLQSLIKDYPAAREAFTKLLALEPDNILGNANMAHAWTNEVLTRRQNGDWKLLDKDVISPKQQAAYDAELEEALSYYRNARPYMEKVREVAPERSKVWAPALQQIYKNLGMQAEADEMDEVMRTNH